MDCNHGRDSWSGELVQEAWLYIVKLGTAEVLGFFKAPKAISAWSPCHRYLAVSNETRIHRNCVATVAIFDLIQRSLHQMPHVLRWPHDERKQLAWAPDSSHLALEMVGVSSAFDADVMLTYEEWADAALGSCGAMISFAAD